jgi:uncharacterized membrane protein
MWILMSTVECTLYLTCSFTKILVEKMNSQTNEKVNGVIYLRTEVVIIIMKLNKPDILYISNMVIYYII